jgi:hypothetical protein
MIYLDKLNVLLNAILIKDIVDITERKVYIPFLGNTYSEVKLRKWLRKRIDVLEDVRDGNYTDAQIEAFINNVYDKLGIADKLIADKIIAGENYIFSPSDETNYENLVLILLYKFVTTP